MKKGVFLRSNLLQLLQALTIAEHYMLKREILNVAKCGSSLALSGSIMHPTTYPCNMCANKIAQLGIGKVVYLEPYPMKEAKQILTEGMVAQECFEGVSFKGYFRLFGGRSYDKDMSKMQ